MEFAYQKMSFWRRLRGHFHTVCTHKRYVAEGCFKIGLYRQGILHDLSKFTPLEFGTGVRYYDGHRSPNAVERMVNDGCSESWLHHKGRNRHHFEYWVDWRKTPAGKVIYAGNRMPIRYVAEMFCDRIAASRVYLGDRYTDAAPYEYLMRDVPEGVMHPDTIREIETMLRVLKEEGEEKAFAYVKKRLKEADKYK